MSSDRNCVVQTRLSEAEKAELEIKARRLGTTTSSLLRSLAKMPVDVYREGMDDDSDFIVFDRKALTRLTQSINACGSLYNQAVKAMNTIAKHGAKDDRFLHVELDHIATQLDQISSNLMLIEADAHVLTDKAMTYLDDADGRARKSNRTVWF